MLPMIATKKRRGWAVRACAGAGGAGVRGMAFFEFCEP